ncbi:MAG: hypothetical protein WA252_03600 [Candidatus Sulfotelmatobacter sp.]
MPTILLIQYAQSPAAVPPLLAQLVTRLERLVSGKKLIWDLIRQRRDAISLDSPRPSHVCAYKFKFFLASVAIFSDISRLYR